MKSTLQTRILVRFMGEKAVKNLIEEYNENRRGGRQMLPPSDIDKRIYARFKELKSARLVAAAFKCSTPKVHYSVSRCVAYENR